jgi:hypothetical protein
MLGNEVTLEFKAKSLFSAIAASSNKALHLTAKSAVSLRYTLLLSASELCR